MAIQIEQEQVGSIRVLELSGRLDTETAADVELALQDLFAAGEREYVIDLSGIGYVSSAGLRVLLSLAKQLDGGKGSLRLCGLNAAVTQVFEVAGFSKLFAIFPDRTAALPKVVQGKADFSLGQKVAKLMGVTARAAPTNPAAAELARSVALLLGIKQPKSAASAKPAPQSRPVTAPNPVVVITGLFAKLRGVFGGKR
jgi:anti-anti-sigma factor